MTRLLDHELQPLREPHGRSAPLLDGLKVLIRQSSAAERLGEPVGGGDRVLHRHVDRQRRRPATSHALHRRCKGVRAATIS